MSLRIATLALLASLAAASASADEWPGWRGPRGDGTSIEPSFPLRWSATENVIWKVSIPGKGHSSPVVWGDRILVTSCLEDSSERKLLCLDRKDGRVLWETVVLTIPLEGKHKLNSFASSTPVTDGKRIWLAFLDGKHFDVFCYDFEGKLLWKTSPGEFHSMHGFCSSPVLYKDLVIFNGDQDAEAYIVALDQATGKERWRTDRPNRERSYVPPVIFEAGGRPQLVLSGSRCVASYDPGTGKQIWIIDGPTRQFVASMVYTEGVFFISGGFPEYHVLGIKPDGEGNVTQTHILWRDKGQEICSYVPSPVAWGSHFFIVSDIGFATCFEAKTGKRMWKEKLGGKPEGKQGAHHSASPVAAAGYLYFIDDDGVTRVLKAGPAFDLVSKNELGEACYASPALSRGRIYIRALKNLYCIGESSK
jgi:outer membrane protein assembly factor BamB